MNPALAWRLWQVSARSTCKRFGKALQAPRETQAHTLQQILRHASGSRFAKEHEIHAGLGPDEFARRVPVMDAAALSVATDAILTGREKVQFGPPVERLIPTSGSTGPVKLIPMCAASRHEYAQAINLWITDLLRTAPAIRKGRAYIATSPALDSPYPAAAIPVGYAEDEAYLGALERHILGSLLAVPTSVARLRMNAPATEGWPTANDDCRPGLCPRRLANRSNAPATEGWPTANDDCRPGLCPRRFPAKDSGWRETVRGHLLAASDLRFLSLWHPSYLEALFSESEFSCLAARWPRLEVISCWADGVCREAAERLCAYFPAARLHPKGLWLTEGVVTVPWYGEYPLALLNGYYEFEDESGAPVPLGALAKGRAYRVLLTNHAGLYRYRLGDLVEVTGTLHATPSLRWVGRADAVSDLCGEKLSEAQIERALRVARIAGDARLLPAPDRNPPAYMLITQDPQPDIAALEAALRDNPQYRWARELGQLGPLFQCLADRQFGRNSVRSKASRLSP